MLFVRIVSYLTWIQYQSANNVVLESVNHINNRTLAIFPFRIFGMVSLENTSIMTGI